MTTFDPAPPGSWAARENARLAALKPTNPNQASGSGLAGQIAANPLSINDATKQQIVGQQSDQALRGYNQGRTKLRAALASAGALDSPNGMAKEVQLSNQLGANLQGISRDANVLQAQTNFSDRLASLGALSGAQNSAANAFQVYQPYNQAAADNINASVAAQNAHANSLMNPGQGQGASYYQPFAGGAGAGGGNKGVRIFGGPTQQAKPMFNYF
jgi:hypothetical protein